MSHIHGDSVEEIELEAQERMEKAYEDLRREMASIRTGRASVHLLDGIKVDYYGTMTPIHQMASVSAPEPAMVTIQPWDSSQIGAIEKAILAADLGITPANDGKLIRLKIPALTEERRKQLVRHLHQITENHRVAVRNARREANDALKKLEKDKTISEDEGRVGHDEIQKLTDEWIAKIDESSSKKEGEIMEIG